MRVVAGLVVLSLFPLVLVLMLRDEREQALARDRDWLRALLRDVLGRQV